MKDWLFDFYGMETLGMKFNLNKFRNNRIWWRRWSIPSRQIDANHKDRYQVQQQGGKKREMCATIRSGSIEHRWPSEIFGRGARSVRLRALKVNQGTASIKPESRYATGKYGSPIHWIPHSPICALRFYHQALYLSKEIPLEIKPAKG